MTKPIGIQLYTLRDALAQDFEGVIRRIAEIGYDGVETAGFPASVTDRQAADLFQLLGLKVPSGHRPLPLGDNKQELLDTMATLGCTYYICPYIPPEEFKTLDQVRHHCDRLNEANAIVREAGMRLAYHNHWWEYQPVDGWYPYQVMLEHLEPTVLFEVDAYWVQTGGLDPLAVVHELGDRAPLLHVKDGPANDSQAPMVAVGEGVMNYGQIIPAMQSVEWLHVELDRCATDMLEAVEKSYHHVKGLGYGQKS
jgi:sugar phosphate isomerase/epimerase